MEQNNLIEKLVEPAKLVGGLIAAVATAMGLIGFGYSMGASNLEERLEGARIEARDEAKTSAEARITQLYEQRIAAMKVDHDRQLRDRAEAARGAGIREGREESDKAYRSSEQFRQLQASVERLRESPEVRNSLTPEDRSALDATSNALEKGDLEKAVSLFPLGVRAIEENNCVPASRSIVVDIGTTITACERSVRASISGYELERKLKVGMYGKTFEGYPGETLALDDGPCGVVFEKNLVKSEPPAAQVSFVCKDQ
jgi:hypothetical protein